jgi:hypothetical protein
MLRERRRNSGEGLGSHRDLVVEGWGRRCDYGLCTGLVAKVGDGDPLVVEGEEKKKARGRKEDVDVRRRNKNEFKKFGTSLPHDHV